MTADYRPVSLAELRGPVRLLGGVDWGATQDRSAVCGIARAIVPREPAFQVVLAHAWRSGYPLHLVVDELAESPAHWAALSLESNGLGLPLAQAVVRRIRERPPEAGGALPQPHRVLEGAALNAWLDNDERAVAQRDPTLFALTGAAAFSEPTPRSVREFATRLRLVHSSPALKATMYSAIKLLVNRQRLLLPTSAEDLRREPPRTCAASS